MIIILDLHFLKDIIKIAQKKYLYKRLIIQGKAKIKEKLENLVLGD